MDDTSMSSVATSPRTRRPATLPEAGPQRPAERRPVEISVIMPTVFWSGTFERCGRRVLSMLDGTKAAVEVVFAFDGSAPPAPAWMDHPAVTVVKTGSRSGPAAARNAAARAA